MHWTHTYSPSSGIAYEAAYGLLALAAVTAAWFAPRPVVVVLALAAAALYVYWGDRVMAIQPAALLITLAILVLGRERLPRSWLWLAGAILFVNLLQGLTPAAPLYFLYAPLVSFPGSFSVPSCSGARWTLGRRSPWQCTSRPYTC